jgi:putative transposase
VLDESHVVACARSVECNPVRAGLVKRAKALRWSSARAHLGAKPDGIVALKPLQDLTPDWAGLLSKPMGNAGLEEIRGHVGSGLPLGSLRRIAKLERRLAPA